MPKRILISTFGSLGDLHPTIAVALELQRRGHEPIIATSEHYRARLEKENLTIHPVRPDVSRQSVGDGSIPDSKVLAKGAEWLVKQSIVGNLRNTYDDVMKIVPSCDLILGRALLPAANLAAITTGTKWMTVVIPPISLWSIYDPPVPPSYCAPRRFKRIRAHPLNHYYLKRKFERMIDSWTQPLRDFERELGLRDSVGIVGGKSSPYGSLALFSSVMAKPQRDWPKPTTVCGFCFYDGQSGGDRDELPESVENFLRKGEPPIVFTLGSLAVYGFSSFFQESVEACRQLGRRGLMLVGHEDHRPDNLQSDDDQIMACDYLPYAAIMKRASAAVHCGGIGTCSEALRAGLPMVIMPCIMDQPDNAGRLERAGVARLIPPDQYKADRLAAELSSLLADGSYRERAGEMAQQIKRENGPVTAVDEIERVMGVA